MEMINYPRRDAMHCLSATAGSMHHQQTQCIASLQFDDFTIFHIIAVNLETDDGSNGLPSLPPGGTGIHVQATQLFIINNLQYV